MIYLQYGPRVARRGKYMDFLGDAALGKGRNVLQFMGSLNEFKYGAHFKMNGLGIDPVKIKQTTEQLKVFAKIGEKSELKDIGFDLDTDLFVINDRLNSLLESFEELTPFQLSIANKDMTSGHMVPAIKTSKSRITVLEGGEIYHINKTPERSYSDGLSHYFRNVSESREDIPPGEIVWSTLQSDFLKNETDVKESGACSS